jgi:ligand-binding sensor domain-containing protein/serine phosphatase RsbU (regulator of sigma subunit)
MATKLRKHLHLILVSLILINSVSSNSQSINFKHYGIDEGLIHPTIYTITQDKNGFIWLGTGAGVCRFDGLKFSVPTSPDSITNSYANTSFCDNAGNVWFGYDDGSVFCFKQRKLRKIFSENATPSVVTSFTQNSSGIIVATTQSSGFYYINENATKIISKGTEGKILYSIANLNGDKYLVGTSDGLWIYSLNPNNSTAIAETKINEIPSTNIQCINKATAEGQFWIGTVDAGFYLLKTGSGKFVVSNIGEKNNLGSANIQWILEDNQKNLWVCTFGTGIQKLLYNSSKSSYDIGPVFNQTNGLSDNYIKIAYQDNEGNIWIGTYSNGLCGIIDEAFVFYNFKKESFGNDILSVVSEKDKFWIGTRENLVEIEVKAAQKKIFTEKNGLPSDDLTVLQIDGNTLWIGTDKSGLYKMDLKTERISKFFSSTNFLENKINAIDYKNNELWVATNGGVFKFDLKTGKHDHYSTDTNLPHNKINDIFVDSKGIVWIATKSNGLFSLNSNKHFKIEGNSELEFTSITEDKTGNIWASTYGDGIFEFHKDSLVYISEKNGLKSDYCYSMITDAEGNIWVGHRLGISKINPEKMNIMTYGTEIGIAGDCNPNAVTIDSSGVLRFGTTDGIIQYNYQKDRQKLSAPQLNLISVKIGDKDIDFNDKIELPYGIYKVKFDFIGLNYRSPASVKYQYKLEGWESEWSELSNNTFANYPRLEDGNFKFLVRAYNAEGICSEPLVIPIYIHPPLWKRWWFILLCAAIIVMLLYSYIKYREKKQIAFQKYLQKLLDERTREVVEQKEEIELKNRDITDSITYAQRIQSSILPSMKKLQDNFSGCFIFYQPRDIVSGDFYWFDKITDNKFVIVCADSTGHGVPGALMSMIGTTLIKDICNRPDVVSPAKILEKLDEEILQTLNQSNEGEKSNDGMDLIACEIDTENHLVKISSAMRPAILYQNGEQIYAQGSTNSIGGNEMMGEIKVFEDQVYQLSKGDLVYMFSDGYPDQFGGPMGKKFKLVRLRNLLKDIHQLPMEEQFHHVKNTFNLWRDQVEQVDDVLFMGIRI